MNIPNDPGRTLEELEENMKDAYLLMTMEDVPPSRGHQKNSLNLMHLLAAILSARAQTVRVASRSPVRCPVVVCGKNLYIRIGTP